MEQPNDLNKIYETEIQDTLDEQIVLSPFEGGDFEMLDPEDRESLFGISDDVTGIVMAAQLGNKNAQIALLGNEMFATEIEESSNGVVTQAEKPSVVSRTIRALIAAGFMGIAALSPMKSAQAGGSSVLKQQILTQILQGTQGVVSAKIDTAVRTHQSQRAENEQVSQIGAQVNAEQAKLAQVQYQKQGVDQALAQLEQNEALMNPSQYIPMHSKLLRDQVTLEQQIRVIQTNIDMGMRQIGAVQRSGSINREATRGASDAQVGADVNAAATTIGAQIDNHIQNRHNGHR